MFDGADFNSSESAISEFETSSAEPRRASAKSKTLSDPIIDLNLTIGDMGVIAFDVPPNLKSDLQNIANELDQIAHLGFDWDSYHAHPIPNKAVRRAFEICVDVIGRFGLFPHIAPMPGGISLSWQADPAQLELEITEHDASLLFTADQDERDEEAISITRAKMLLFEWLSE